MSITASATSAPGHDLVGPARRDTGQVGELVGRHRRSASGSTRAGRRAAARGRRAGRRSDGAAPQMRASERKVLEVAAAMSGGPPRRRWPASWAMSARIFLRSARTVLLARHAVAEVLARQPGRAERERPGDVGLLVGAAGDLERAAADVEDREPAGGPAEPATYGEEGQPRLVLTRQDGDARRRSRSATWSRTASQLPASRTAEVAKPSMSSRPCPRRRRRASATNVVSASMPDLGDLTVASRCSASRNGSL